MIVKISFLDRYALNELLPAQNTTYERLLTREDILEKVKFTADEVRPFLREDQSFNDDALLEQFEIEFSNAEVAAIKDILRRKNDMSKLDIKEKNIYDIFILGKNDNTNRN